MTLHDRIMALQPIGKTSQVSAIHFNNAKMRAAQLATEADEIMAEMAAILSAIERLSGYSGESKLSIALAKYNAYKEQ